MSDNLVQISHEEFVASAPIWQDGLDYKDLNPWAEAAIATGQVKAASYDLPKAYLSVSAINTYLKCPTQFEHRYIDRQRGPSSAAAMQGKCMHTVIEHAYRYKKTELEDPTQEFIQDTYTDAFMENIAHRKELLRDEHETDDFLALQGNVVLETWRKLKLPKVNPVDIEVTYMQNVAGVPLVGVIDLVDHQDLGIPATQGANRRYDPFAHKVVDTKTVKRTWNQDMADNSLQLSMYSIATGLPDLRVDCLVKGNPKSIINAGTRTKGPSIVELDTRRRAGQNQWAMQLVTQVARAIQAGSFPPCSPESWACSAKYCGFWGMCRGKYV